MKYAITTPEDLILSISDTEPTSGTYVQITDEQATEVENASTIGMYYAIADAYGIGQIYNISEYSDKLRFEADPDQYKAILRRYFAMQRYNDEIAGIQVNGITIKSDRITQSILGNARHLADEDPAFSVDWKVSDGQFVQLDSPTIIAISNAVAAYVQALFTKEKNLNLQIAAATTYEEIRNIVW